MDYEFKFTPVDVIPEKDRRQQHKGKYPRMIDAFLKSGLQMVDASENVPAKRIKPTCVDIKKHIIKKKLEDKMSCTTRGNTLYLYRIPVKTIVE